MVSDGRDNLHGMGPNRVELLERNRALEALNALAARLLRLDTAAAVYDAALDGVLAIVGATSGALTLTDDARRRFRVVAWRGYSAETRREIEQLTYEAPLAHNVARLSGELVIVHLDGASATPTVLAGEPAQTAVLLPLFPGDRVVGVLSYVLPRRHESSPDERALLRTAATYVGAALDRAQLYETAEAERARLARILEELPIGIYLAEGEAAARSLRWTLINGAGHAQIGTPLPPVDDPDASYGIYWPDGRPVPVDERPLESALWTGQPTPPREYVIRTADGTERVFLSSARLLRDEDGTREAVLVAQEATDRVRVRRELEDQRALLQTILETAPVGLALYDCDLRVINFNAEWAWLAGIAPMDIAGRSLYDLIPDTRTRQASYARVLAGEAVDLADVVYLRPGDAAPRYYDLRYRPVRDPDGTVKGILCAVLDVTMRYEASRQKDEFIALASHELKTPLTAIKAYAQTTLRAVRHLGDPRLLRTLRIIDEQSDRLNRLINELLDVSSMETEPLALEREPVDLGDLVRDAVSSLELIAPAFTLALDLPPAPIPIHADRQRVEQVLMNLVQNAIKYSGDSRRVEIGVRAADGEAVTAIRDFGLGIPVDQQEQVFERFFRARNVPSYHYSGLGLGLFISHNIVVRHGGRMWLESYEGVGSTFYFALPLAGP